MQATYNSWLVALSIVVAMVVAYTALKLAARVAEAGPSGGRLWLLGGAAAMGMGIWSMHFIGMLAYSVEIPLRYGIVKTLLSLAIAIVTSGFALGIAVGASFAALWLAFKLRSGQSTYIALARGGAAVIMGLAISGMHYTAMAASKIAAGSYCFGGASLDNGWLASTIGIVSLGVLALTLITAVYDAHLVSQTRQDALRLAKVNT